MLHCQVARLFDALGHHTPFVVVRQQRVCSTIDERRGHHSGQCRAHVRAVAVVAQCTPCQIVLLAFSTRERVASLLKMVVQV